MLVLSKKDLICVKHYSSSSCSKLQHDLIHIDPKCASSFNQNYSFDRHFINRKHGFTLTMLRYLLDKKKSSNIDNNAFIPEDARKF